ncbi:MAG TPA: adenine deaminase [Bacteroidales bacterium]|nr:adenine deaminase [Bacteroidales bacterium]
MKIISGKLVDIHNRKIFSAEVIIEGSKITKINRVDSSRNVFLLPGFTDSHVHIESSMITPGAFATAAVKHGTVAVVSDPHEIANVMGIAGVEFMLDDARKVPFKFYFGAPSCVPATTFETSGGTITSNDIVNLLNDSRISYLAEMMNFPGVIYGDDEVSRKIAAAKKVNKPIDGHAPGLRGDSLKKYVTAGISTDHECSTIDEALEKIKLGMKILIREGSAARNLDALKDLIRTNSEMVMLCSDDLHPEMLESRHINKVVAKLINEGFNIYDILKCTSINPKLHYGLETGTLKVGDPADFIIVEKLEDMNVLETWIDGSKVYDNGIIQFNYEPAKEVNNFNCSAINIDDILIRNQKKRIRVIEAIEGELMTNEILWNTLGEYVEPDIEKDILKIVVKDRYKDSSPVTGFIKGFGLKNGAIASSVAHDSHNIIAVGASNDDIVKAMNQIIRMKGGLSVCSGGMLNYLMLDIAGIMTARSCNQIASEYLKLNQLTALNGCQMKAPFMTLSFMALLVIPDLKIGDKGLFSVKEFKPISLFID